MHMLPLGVNEAVCCVFGCLFSCVFCGVCCVGSFVSALFCVIFHLCSCGGLLCLLCVHSCV